jgi:uncharacterized protein (DUF1778 family)
MSTTASVRVTSRISQQLQEKLQLAADMMGTTLNQFVIQAAAEKAEKMVENEQRLLLTRRESMRILGLLENPPMMNDKLTSLMTDYDRRKLNDAHSAFSWSPQ